MGATSKSFITFIDLRKAYESVPREAMWQTRVEGAEDVGIRLNYRSSGGTLGMPASSS